MKDEMQSDFTQFSVKQRDNERNLNTAFLDETVFN